MKAIRALMLVLALSACAYAGDMPCGRDGDMPNGKDGDMGAGGFAGEIHNPKADIATDIILSLLQGMLPLF